MKVGDGIGKAFLGDLFRWWSLTPVGFADEDDSVGVEALRQKLDGAGDSAADPCGADTGGHTALVVGDVSGRVAMNEFDFVGDAEFFSAVFCLPAEQLAHVDTDAGDSVIARPGAQHLARTAAEVEYTSPRFKAQHGAERGELFRRERVVNAVGAFGNVEDAWDIQCREPFNKYE